MIKLINLVFALLSLIVLVAITYVLNDALESLSTIWGESVNFELLKEVLSEGSTDEIMYSIAILGVSLFTLFGFPVTIFLVSINSLKD